MAGLPHFSVPFQFGTNGQAVVVEQDTVAEIASCCRVVLSCPVGHRPELPAFGLVEQEFRQGGPDADAIRAALATWEPRADAEVEIGPPLDVTVNRPARPVLREHIIVVDGAAIEPAVPRTRTLPGDPGDPVVIVNINARTTEA